MNLSYDLKSKKLAPAIILAAGTSGRMGFPKAALKFNDSENFIQHLCTQFLHAGCEKVIIVINSDTAKLFIENNITFPKNVITVINHYPEYGRFYSLQLGLKNCTNTDAVFITNVDNPFADSDLLVKLQTNVNSADYIYPVFKRKGGHPILISSKIIVDISQSDYRNVILRDFLQRFKSKAVEVNSEKILSNINSENDYLELIMHNSKRQDFGIG